MADLKDFAIFHEFISEARNLRNQKEEDRLRAEEEEVLARERRFKKLSAIMERMTPVLQARAEGEMDGESASRKLREICPDKHTQMEVVELLFSLLKESPTMTDEELAAKEREIDEREKELAARERERAENQKLIDASEQAHQALEILSSRIQAGDERAIEGAASIAEHAIILLLVAERMHPVATRKVAAMRMHWPIPGSREPGWQQRAATHLESLQVGSGLEFLRTKFREARGADGNYPARQWAKAAVRTIEETKIRYAMLGDCFDEFWELILERGIEVSSTPDWVKGALPLPRLSIRTAREWGTVIREMIRDQVPEFHSLPEWESQRNTANHNCRDSRGEVQNAILDDIVSALRSIAPTVIVLKSGS